MRKYIFFKIFIFIVIVLYGPFSFLSLSGAKGVKTSYKRYSIFKYKNEEVLCEPYIVNKDDWLYKIFRKKGEIAEKDFPSFIIIFKEINPEISNIDAIKPNINILIPLKKVKKGDYDQNTPGNIDIPLIEFSTIPENLDLKPFIQEHKIEKGETVSHLIDKDFLNKSGAISKEGLKAFQIANPHIKDINIIYEGDDIYLPDSSIKSQPWFKSLFSGKTKLIGTQNKKPKIKQHKIEAHKLAQLKKYSSLIGGTLLNHGKMYFPGKNNSSQILDLSSTPIIETDDGSKILIVSGDSIDDELLEYVQTYWNDLKTQLISDAIDKIKEHHKTIPKRNIIAEHKKMVEILLSQTGYEYIPNAKIPFNIQNMFLEASFGQVIRKDKTDLLINFGDVYGSALEVIEKREFEIISITPKLHPLELAGKLFSHLGYTTWENPAFSTEGAIKSINGLYAAKNKDKLFIHITPLSMDAMNYLKNEKIKTLSIINKTQVQ